MPIVPRLIIEQRGLNVRVRSKWHNKDKSKSIEDIAGALGFVTWRIASSAVNKMYNAGFNYRTNAQQLDVIGEFLAFLIQVADRLAYDRMDDEERQRFITALALHVTHTLADNQTDELGPGDYQGPFLGKLNERLDAYSEFGFVDESPSYPFLRYLGSCVDAVMGGEDNKWVIEHVMEIEAPVAVKTLRKAMTDLLEGRKPELDEE